ncbi:unnamed protein product [Closterium sp. Yama58-4]|nr:unnamed protein product [Closterium sp. Yama58-4]
MVDKVVRTVATLLGNSSVWKIAKTIESTTGDLAERYLTPEKAFGGEGKSWLVNSLKVHKEGGGKQEAEGAQQGSTYADCVKLCRKFAKDCVDNLNDWLDDLGKLGPTKLFRAAKWPKIKAQREKKCKEWLNGCSRLFRNKLPGFDLKAAERELPTFCAIMESHHEMESFTQGLSNFLGSPDSKRRRPAKSLKLAVAERERKGKQKEGEDVAAGHAGENEDEVEEEEDDEVEQAFGNDQEVVEEEEVEDNPFLSDDEDVEEVYFIDKPVH